MIKAFVFGGLGALAVSALILGIGYGLIKLVLFLAKGSNDVAALIGIGIAVFVLGGFHVLAEVRE